MATVTFLEAGTDETQDLTFWPNIALAGSGTVASAGDQAHTGSRSLKLVTTGSSDSAYIASGDGACADAGTVVSFWVRFSAIPSTDMTFMATWQAGFGNGPIALTVTSSGKIQLVRDNNAATVGAAGGTTISATTWTRITWTWVITSGTNWTSKVYINGVLEFTRTNADATLTITGTSEIGPTLDKALQSGAVSAVSVWYDDFYIDNGTAHADPGAIQVTAKRPFANGTTNGFTGTGTPSGYGSGNARYVNEQPLSTSNFVSVIAAGSAITEEYTIEGASVGDVDLTGATIVGVRGWIYTKALVAETGKIVVDGTQTNISITTSNALFTQNSATPTAYPAGTGTDIGEVTATTATTISLYECGVLVAYTPAAGGFTAKFRKTLSGIGTRVGSRQVQGWG